MKRTKIVTAVNQTRAPWMEAATPKTSYTKLKLLHQPQEKHASGFATPQLKHRNHTCSIRNERYRNATELSKHVWNLEDQNIKFDIKWRKVKQACSYSNVTKKCNLCLCEKYFIICKPEMSTLNNRNELTSCCRHSRKFLLKNVIT